MRICGAGAVALAGAFVEDVGPTGGVGAYGGEFLQIGGVEHGSEPTDVGRKLIAQRGVYARRPDLRKVLGTLGQARDRTGHRIALDQIAEGPGSGRAKAENLGCGLGGDRVTYGDVVPIGRQRQPRNGAGLEGEAGTEGIRGLGLELGVA